MLYYGAFDDSNITSAVAAIATDRNGIPPVATPEEVISDNTLIDDGGDARASVLASRELGGLAL